MVHYAEILLPLNISACMTYIMPEGSVLGDNYGKRVAVDMKGAIYTGIILEEHSDEPQGYKPKPVIEILDDEPVVDRRQIELWQWTASYYACTVGEVMRAALPSALKIESRTKIELLEHSIPDGELSDDEFMVCEALENNKNLTVDDVSSILGRKNVLPLLKKMMQKGLVSVFMEYAERYRPLMENFVYIGKDYFSGSGGMEKAMEATARSEKQRALLMAALGIKAQGKEPLTKKELLEYCGASPTVLDGLVKKRILEVRREETDRIKGRPSDKPIKALSTEQEQALAEIKNSFAEGRPALLHGVTGSGKTEIYVRLIKETLEKGGQVLYLLPEIALTTQLVGRLKQYFGEKIGVYHSKYNDMQRAEVWQRVKSGGNNRFDIIMGARSAVFLPFDKLSLIVVDEEHEQSYKQQDPSPRYHARDTAMVLASMSGAHVVLGSATPSVESYHNALQGKYSLVSLPHRYADVAMPEINVVNIKEAYAAGKMKGHFSHELIERTKEAIGSGRQVILFQNRRGYAPVVECRDCGWTPQCRHCDVSLTYHKHSDNMRCHYCGYNEPRPQRCPQCGSVRLDTKGFGTEQVEAEAAKLFPDARILRMDLDTTGGKNSYQSIITAFENGQADILIGTQMIAKGLDFGNVSLVGILNADYSFKNADFRAFERGYQLLSQIGGRAGRKERGQVILQTYEPEHEVIRNVVNGGYQSMYRDVMKHRRQFIYPPFCRMIRVVLRHKETETLDAAAAVFAGRLRQILPDNVLGPDYYQITSITSLYIEHLYKKLPQEVSLKGVKEYLSKLSSAFSSSREYRTVRITIDVDPA